MRANCVICVSYFTSQDKICACPCGHVFHEDCLSRWLKNSKTCPFCRKDIAKNRVITLFFPNDSVENDHPIDVEGLQNKVISIEAKLYNEETKLKAIQEQCSKEKHINMELRKECKKSHQQNEKLQGALSIVNQQLKQLNHIQPDYNRVLEENSKLIKRLKLLQHVERILNGCETDLGELLFEYNDPESRNQILQTFHKFLQIELEKKRTVEKMLKEERDSEKRKNQVIEEQFRDLQKVVADKANEIEQLKAENLSLERKLNAVSEKISMNDSLQRVIHESPAPAVRHDCRVHVMQNSETLNESHDIIQPSTPFHQEFKSKMSVQYSDIYSDKKKFIVPVIKSKAVSSKGGFRTCYDGMGGHRQEPIESKWSPKFKSKVMNKGPRIKVKTKRSTIKVKTKGLNVNGQNISNFFSVE